MGAVACVDSTLTCSICKSKLTRPSIACLLAFCPRFREFLPYMESEILALNDTSMDQEVDMLQRVLAS